MVVDVLNICDFKCENITILSLLYMDYEVKCMPFGTLYKNLDCTSKKTPYATITSINWLMLFKEIIAVYTENHTNTINTKYGVTES
jgi:hypothetical protein